MANERGVYRRRKQPLASVRHGEVLDAMDEMIYAEYQLEVCVRRGIAKRSAYDQAKLDAKRTNGWDHGRMFRSE